MEHPYQLEGISIKEILNENININKNKNKRNLEGENINNLIKDEFTISNIIKKIEKLNIKDEIISKRNLRVKLFCKMCNSSYINNCKCRI